ncbi:MAG: hypothetical protein BM558_06165 [Roseobacter sp. MedPE-SW]|nr:MAG: hypothetical protein BM558_06165 [Roseobacter sp. MedPE-SW]
MLKRIHPIAGVIGFMMILTFWTSTAYSELFSTAAGIAVVKAMILKGMFVLVPAMMIVGASGMQLGARRKDAPARAKKKSMPIIAANGLVILLPAAFFLEARASAGQFDTAFYLVQSIELIAGGANLVLMGLSIRDGRRMVKARR